MAAGCGWRARLNSSSSSVHQPLSGICNSNEAERDVNARTGQTGDRRRLDLRPGRGWMGFNAIGIKLGQFAKRVHVAVPVALERLINFEVSRRISP